MLYDPATPHLYTHSKDSMSNRDICIPMFITPVLPIYNRYKMEPAQITVNRLDDKNVTLYRVKFQWVVKKKEHPN